ncbi:hypothetical protein [Nocardia yamanashiensis]|uniref:hypothetical protein n=1 Tax=Nocardia yamanashiensis TaxID=209247 RepID=UPI0012FDCF91|nr:hypothetical protein [Nocardia yamanashiensis]
MRSLLARLDLRWRRRIRWMLGILFALFVFPGIVGAVATADGGSGGSRIDGLAWMDVRDSSGVPVANYQFVTNHGSLLALDNTTISTLLGLEFIGYLAIVITAIWLIGYALSFQWLNLLNDSLAGMARTFAHQLATPAVLVAAAGIGAFCVAWFLLRGYHAKAVVQVVTMLAVAIMGPVYLADPLGEVLSSDGLLAQGRNVGVAVAAGLTGDANPNINRLVTGFQGNLADHFVRIPLQVWNFGHVIDDLPACRTMWSAAMTAANEDAVKKGLRACGDNTAATRADHPHLGQVGTGVIVLVCGALLLAFAAVLAVRIIRAALDTIWTAFATVFGFAVGGFIYGPTQNNLIRSLVHSLVAAARMTLYTMFLGVYMLLLSSIFRQAHGEVMKVLVTACVIEVVAITQLKNLGRSLSAGNEWIANRFASAVQGGMARAGAGGGSALGMGSAHARASLGRGMVAKLGALGTVNNSALTAWLMAKTPGPLNPNARKRRDTELINMDNAPMNLDSNIWNQRARDGWRLKAEQRALADRPTSLLSGFNILDGLGDSKVPDALMIPLLTERGFSADQANLMLRVLSVQRASRSNNPAGVAPLQNAVAATNAIHNHLRDSDSDQVIMAFASQAVVASDNFLRHAMAPIDAAKVDQLFVDKVLNASGSEARLAAITPQEWQRANRDTQRQIGNELAQRHNDAAQEYEQVLYNGASPRGPEAAAARRKLLQATLPINYLHPENNPSRPSPFHTFG